jgi:hypothetical protein
LSCRQFAGNSADVGPPSGPRGPNDADRLRTITSTTPGENLGFDAVGIGVVSRDHRPGLLASAAEGDTLYVIAGTGRR